MKKGLFLLLAGTMFVSCQKDAVETLQGEVGALETTVADLQTQIDVLTANDVELLSTITTVGNSVVALGDIVSDVSLDVHTQLTDLLQRIVDAEADIILTGEDINDVAADVAALDIPTIEGLATEDDLAAVAADVDALGTISDDLTDLVAVVDALVLEVADVASDVVAIEPTLAIKGDFLPAFDVQIANFTQTQSTTIADVFVEATTRDIVVENDGGVATTVTSTILLQELNVADFGDGADLSTEITQTTTSTLYLFKLDDVKVYEHTTSATSSWTLN